MKFSEQWLRDWVDPSISTDELAHQLTMAGIEVEQITSLAGELKGVLVGEITAISPHPNADKLRICEVNVGQDKPLTIVSAGINARPGIKVPVACLESVLSNGVKIKRAKLRGIESEGMMCSATELGLESTAEGLLELPPTAPLGQDIRTYLQLNDNILEVKLTPNRGDCLSIAGIAREVAVLNKCTYSAPEIWNVSATINDNLLVKVAKPEQCPVYMGRIIREVDLSAETPVWLQERLRRSGIRNINPVVDVMNYVMLELGQPMHAFDLAKINGNIQVRYANAHESLTLLDNQEIKLREDALVIADDNHVLALAGIMGGLFSAVTTETQAIFLESAHFIPQCIAKTARNYHLTSDSAHRFERGVDPELPTRAIERATALLMSIVGGKPGPIQSEIAPIQAKMEIEFRPHRINKILGISVSLAEIIDILQRLGCEVDNVSLQDNATLIVIPPSYRFDMTREEDIIEEIARIYGYEQIPAAPIHATLSVSAKPENKISTEYLVNCLVDRGYHEVISYSFVDAALQAQLFPDQVALSLVNPISSDLAQMRLSLWPGLLTTLKYNQYRQQPNMRLFEMGLRFVENKQERVISGLIAGQSGADSWNVTNRPLDFYDIKADVEALISSSAKEWIYVPAQHPTLHPTQTAKLEFNGQALGWVGALHPAIVQSLELFGPVFLFELQLDFLEQGRVPQYAPLSKFPLVRRDLSFIVDDKITAQHIRDAIYALNSDILQNIFFFDIYKGKGIEPDQKSMAIGMTLQHSARTLVDNEVNAFVTKVVTTLENNFQMKLRA